jgi:hypothetical protein
MKIGALFTGILIVLVFLAGAAFFFPCEDDWCLLTEAQRVRAVDSFERCAELGFPVMESFPRQCRAGEKHFTEAVSPPAAPPLPIATDKIRISSPLPGAVITSPLMIRGEARGPWYFEASFPLELLDGNGRRLAMIPVQATGEWMTTEFVPFEVALTFAAPSTATGTLVFHKDNPSGLPEHDDSVSVPVRFSP